MKRKMAKKGHEKKFNTILLKSIDEALLTLGENAKSSLYFYLETKFSISRQDIPGRVNDFSDALEQIFGLAARHLEILIMKCLNDKVNCTYKWDGPKWLVPDLTFAKYVKLLELWCGDKEETWELEVTVDAGEQQEQQAR
jgi:hypothetical protein